MKKGKDYELLVEKLYKQLAPNAEITQDDYIIGRNSNTKRQIDVSIRFQNMGINYLTIIQAKDHSRPADIKVVDEFKSVIEDTLANKGVLICSKGFTKKAKEYGMKVGIELLSIHEASNKNWQTLVYIRVKKTIHKIKLEAELSVSYFNNTGRNVSFTPDTPPIFSSNMKDLYSTTDLFRQEILEKGLWSEIISGKPITIDMKQLGAFVFMHDRFLEPEVGELTYRYLRTEVRHLLVEPDNYIYQVDHITGQEKLHNLILTPIKFAEISNPYFSSEKSFDQIEPHFDFVNYDIIHNGYLSFYSTNVKFELQGPRLPADNPSVKRMERYTEIKSMINLGLLKSND